MEASNFFIVILEILISFSGAVVFAQRIFLLNRKINSRNLFLIILCIISLFWPLLSDQQGRWLGFKAVLFLACLYYSYRYPNRSLSIVLGLLIFNFFSGLISGEFGSKYFLPSLALMVCCIFIIMRDRIQLPLELIYFFGFFDIFYAITYGARGFGVSTLIALVVIRFKSVAYFFVKYYLWIPIAYLALMLLVYLFILDFEGLEKSASNIERSVMIFAAVSNLDQYIIQGPKKEFDNMVDQLMSYFNFKHYESEMGIDPHSFFLSIWRDEGLLLMTFWFVAWVLYWSLLKKTTYALLWRSTIRVSLGFLSFAVIPISLSPPDTSTRLMAALILGSCLGLNYLKKP